MSGSAAMIKVLHNHRRRLHEGPEGRVFVRALAIPIVAAVTILLKRLDIRSHCDKGLDAVNVDHEGKDKMDNLLEGPWCAVKWVALLSLTLLLKLPRHVREPFRRLRV